MWFNFLSNSTYSAPPSLFCSLRILHKAFWSYSPPLPWSAYSFLNGQIIKMFQKSKTKFSVKTMSELNCVGHLDTLSPFGKRFPVPPGCRATMFSSVNWNSALPFFIYVALICFPHWHQITCSQQGKLIHPLALTVWRTNPCVIIPRLNAPICLHERLQPAQLKSASMATCSGVTEAEWDNIGNMLDLTVCF